MLRDRPPGGVLHEPVRTWNYQELSYQFATLEHRHPIVNGISGYDTPLQMLFRDHDSVLYDTTHAADVVRMLRAIGIRYVVVNVGDYSSAQIANGEDREMLRLLRGSGQIVEEQRVLDAVAFELAPPIPPPAPEPLVRVDRRDLAVRVSNGSDRAALVLDGDAETRWFADQNGENWIEVRFRQRCDVARVEMWLAERSITDYPRELQIDSADERGATRTLYRATPYPEFLIGFLRDPSYPRLEIALPPNESTTLTIRETGTAPGRWWSVHELHVWRRR
jgi:hypothetical protein